jgi:hypothetical protein
LNHSASQIDGAGRPLPQSASTSFPFTRAQPLLAAGIQHLETQPKLQEVATVKQIIPLFCALVPLLAVVGACTAS